MSQAPAIVKPLEEVRQALAMPANIAELKAALPKHVDIDKFRRVAMTAIERNPALLDLERASLYMALKACAADGLMPDGREATITPFKGKAAYMPMVAGILKKVRNSGELSSVNAQVVYEKDDFEYNIDETGEHLKHRPFLDGDRGKRRMTYAVARTKDGGVYVEVISEGQMESIKKLGANGGPWNGPFEDEMRRKSAIRRLSKRLPMSTDLDEVIRADDKFHELEPEREAGPVTPARAVAAVAAEPAEAEPAAQPAGQERKSPI